MVRRKHQNRQPHFLLLRVKHYDEGSQHRHQTEGRISKLTVRPSGTVRRFATMTIGGWDIEPADESTATALAILMKDYN